MRQRLCEYITAQAIILSSSVEIVNSTQPIANSRETINFYSIELQMKRDRGYHTELRKNTQDGSYPIDDVSISFRNVNYNIFSCGYINENMRYFFLKYE